MPRSRRWLCCSLGFEEIDIADIPDVPDLPRAVVGQPGSGKVPSRLIVSVISSGHGPVPGASQAPLACGRDELGSGTEQPQPPTAAATGKPRSVASGARQRDGGGGGRAGTTAVTSSPHRSYPGCWIQDRRSETGRGLGHRR